MRNSGGGNFAAVPVPIQKRKGNVAKQMITGSALDRVEVRRGAVKIASSGGMESVTPIVFRKPDGGYMAVVVNCTDHRDQDFRLLYEGWQFTSLPAGIAGTYCWVAALD